MKSTSVEETYAYAKDLVDSLKPGSTATVVGLHGNLGSAKTTFMKGVAEALDIEETVTSPTFVILKRFDIPSGGFKSLIHIDAYRLEGGKDLEVLGWKEMVAGPENLIFIEWADLVQKALPENTKRVDFEFVDENTREITIK